MNQIKIVNAVRGVCLAAVMASVPATLLWPAEAHAASRAETSAEAKAALKRLYAAEPQVEILYSKAVAVLVFPDIIKAGLVVGGEAGNGALMKKDGTETYYNLTGISFGLQAGAQTYGYALFFMNQAALDYLNRSDGWSVGVGPNVVIVDDAAAKIINTTTLTQDVYAVPFGEKGLMAGIGLEGAKISRLKND